MRLFQAFGVFCHWKHENPVTQNKPKFVLHSGEMQTHIGFRQFIEHRPLGYPKVSKAACDLPKSASCFLQRTLSTTRKKGSWSGGRVFCGHDKFSVTRLFHLTALS